MKTRRLLLLLLAAAAIAAFFFLDLGRYLSLEVLKTQQEALQGYAAANPLKSAAIFFGIYVGATALSIPGAVILTLAAGAVFGLWRGLLIVSFASAIGATLAFLAARFLLREAHQDANLKQVMCRSLVSVDYQGYLYDCDFNQMLGMPMRHEGSGRMHLSDMLMRDLQGQPVAVADHCWGCTAGAGSSCGGALA